MAEPNGPRRPSDRSETARLSDVVAGGRQFCHHRPAAVQAGEGMMKLQVFGDEGDQLPLHDTDEPLVTAAVATIASDDLARLPCRPSNAFHTVRLLDELQAHVACLYVRPTPGYARALERRYDRLSGMALITRRRTGENAAYVGSDGIRRRNAVWSYAVSSAVMFAVFDFVEDQQGFPSTVSVFLDAKTLTREARQLVEVKTRQLGWSIHGGLIATLQRRPDGEVALRPLLAQRIEPHQVSVEWKRDPGFSGSPGGLYVAHSVASGVFQALRRKRPRRDMWDALQAAGYGDCLVDVTGIVTARPHGAHVDRWQQEYGVVLPP